MIRVMLLWLCRVSLGVLFSLVMLLVLVGATHPGTVLAVRATAYFLSEHVSIGQVQGRLLGSLNLEQVVYSSSNIHFAAGKIHLNWQPLALLKKKLLIDQVEITDAQLAIEKNPSKVPQATHRGGSLIPFPLQIDRLQLTRVKVYYLDQPPLQLQNLTAYLRYDSSTVAVDIKANVTSPARFSSHVAIMGSPAAYQWQFGLQNPGTDWQVSGEGGKNGTTVNTDKPRAFGGQLSAQGSVNWLPIPSWDLKISSTAVNLKPLTATVPADLSFLLNSHGDINSFDLKVKNLYAQVQGTPVRGYFNLQTQLNQPLNSSAKTISQLVNDIGAWHFNIASAIQFGNAVINVQGSLADKWQLAYRLHIPDLTRLPVDLAGSIDLTGQMTGVYHNPSLNAQLLMNSLKSLQQPDALFQGKFLLHARALFTETVPDIAAEILLKNGQISYKTSNKLLLFPLDGTFKLHADNTRLVAESDVRLRHKKFISASLLLPGYQYPVLPSQSIQARIRAQLDQTQLVGLSLPWVEKLNGNFSADLQADGSLAEPKLQGQAILNSRQLYLPQLNLPLKNLNLQVSLGQGVANYSGSVQADQGKLQLTGSTSRQDQHFKSSLKISGQRFLASNTPQYKIYLSPDVTINSQADGWHIQGVVAVPKAELKLVDSRSVITLPAGTIIIQQSGKTAQTKPVAVFSEVMLQLGDKVQLQASGVNSFLTGQLMIRDYPNSDARANGTLGINGYYELQGQKLAIDQGALMFVNSPISNPNLNIQAVKKIKYKPTDQALAQQDLSVGIQATGTLENPNLHLFSSPAGWSQADILSLIILGEPASAASSASIQLLAAAARTLVPQTSSNGFNQLTNQLQQTFGLSDFGLESGISGEGDSAAKTTAFVLGKYLSPRLYLSYSLDILSAMNTFRLRYTLSKHWSLQSQANTQGSGVDVLYSIEH